MSSIFKAINSSDISLTERTVYKKQTITSTSEGIKSVQYRSGSVEAVNSIYPSTSGSYWDSAKVLFYLSASNLNSSAFRTSESIEYFNRTLAEKRSTNKQYINKFHSSGSIVSIPQPYIGEGIKPGSFLLQDTSGTDEISIQDDGFGNLYAPSASISQSSATSISSSDNYIGNIFYRFGIVTLTETGSWSTGIGYTEVTTGSYSMSFKSTQTLYTQEYLVSIEPGEFNTTMNSTIRGFPTKSLYTKINETPYMADKFTGSNWSPYITTIAFFPRKSKVEKETLRYTLADEPVAIARLPRPIKISNKIPMHFKIRLDI
tara:strand:- start:303 stop:1253 length:951 start_codon:yes stop_codon:yes gene_type:complete